MAGHRLHRASQVRRSDFAAHELLLARTALANAQPTIAHHRGLVAVAKSIEVGAAELTVQAATTCSEALTCRNQLAPASMWALFASRIANETKPGSEDHFWAMCQLFETYEIRGFYEVALEGFRLLEACLPESEAWAESVRLHITNHFISLGMKLNRPDVADAGVGQGLRAEDAALVPDERSAFRQWWALFVLSLGDVGTAREIFDGSLSSRAPTRKRSITKHFPQGHLLFAEGKTFDGLETLDGGISSARDAGLDRYVVAGTYLRRKLFLSPSPIF